MDERHFLLSHSLGSKVQRIMFKNPSTIIIVIVKVELEKMRFCLGTYWYRYRIKYIMILEELQALLMNAGSA
uniref:Ovule protein n=1 Tax=Romanomermis culicivorax TaxID=13658 RepID=A0A915I1W4_ROMCU